MNNDINGIIDSLSAKLGTTSEYLIPELGRFYTTRYIAGIIIMGLLTLTCVLGFLYATKRYKEEMKKHCSDRDEEPYVVIQLFTAVTGIITSGVFIFNIVSLVGWIVSPTAATIEMILNAIGG